MSQPNFYDQVYAVVRKIPRGSVTSYGRVARMLGRPRAARAVGYALNALKDDKDGALTDVPWQRVVNHVGRISIANREHSAHQQADLLRMEGIQIDDALRLENFEQHLWSGLSLFEIDDILSEM